MNEGLIAKLAETPTTVAHLIVEATDEQMDRVQEGEWSARTIVAHFRDDESLVFRSRLERMLAEEHPTLVPFDKKAWAAGRNRSRDRKEELLADFALQRQASVSRFRSLRDEDWERKGTQPEYGTWTVASFLQHWLDHDAVHLAQLQNVLGVTLEQVLARRNPKGS